MTGRAQIVAAAIKYGSLVASVPKPGRHGDIIRALYDETGTRTRGFDEQGFLTSDGRFVDRKEALIIAREADQIVTKNGHPELLFSEDLW